ncbi:acetyl-CoA synthetase-like protein [Stipitochalara longipes BDJ]|nr:acetyl-CoA synthetase-like protein [Stipitochalara longipes BDJ]
MPPTAIDIVPSAGESFSWKSQVKTLETIIPIQTPKVESRAPLTIDELIRQRSQENPREPIISYPSSGLEYVDNTTRQIDIFAHRVAQKYKILMPQRLSSSDPEIVVGLLGPSNFEYFISILALTKLGHSILFLSTRISIAAYVSLLETTGAKYLLVDSSFRETAARVKETCTSVQVHDITDSESYNYPIVDENIDTRLCQHLQPEVESKKISWIIHSSGSTGLPKPIYQTHSAALNNYASNLNLRGFITLPLYHAHGISSVFRSIHSKKQIYMYSASLPLTHQNLLNIMQKYRFDIFYGVPYALKLLGESPEGIEGLAKQKVVMFGGSACPDALGDKLVDHGVNLISHYGTTETGQLMTSFRDLGDKAWDYVRAGDAVKPYLQWEERSPGIFELVVLDGWSSKVASNRPDGSYATKDLFTPHPTIPNAWKYFARLDDTIVLMNGEKVVPNTFEQLIRHEKLVAEAVLFGSGKARLGLMIIPSEAAKNLSADDIRRELVPALNKANKDMPGYAQMALDMTEVLPVGTEYPKTDKGTVIRATFYRKFEAEIEKVYDSADVPSGELSLSELELKEYIRAELLKILPPTSSSLLADDTDFFSIGIDSLQAIQLRTVLSKNIQTNKNKLGSNIVFDFPSINALAEELYRMRTGGKSIVVSAVDKMQDLISKYSVFEPHVPVENSNGANYLVVTGATGSLGAHLVAQLVLREDVKKVYCLVRSSSPANARRRVIRSMRERSVYHYLTLEARRKIVALPSHFGDASLGLYPEIYNEIAANITGLVHCAWSVNFNLALGSFEADCIAGAHNLLALCLKAQRPEPATFNFCSSVSAVARTKGGFVPEALPESLEYAQGMGYAQSKLVTEHICVEAAKAYGIKTRVLRVGQVIADTVHGIWNATEAIPLMMQAALTIGAVPTLDESPLWLPVDVVASTVSDISIGSSGAGVMNVVNHQAFHWTRDLIPALHNAGLSFTELSQKEWVTALRTSNPDPVANPPIKLLEFFASKYDNDLPRTGLTYDTSYAQFLSPSLASAPVLNQFIVNKFVSHFLATSWSTTKTSLSKKRIIFISGPCGSGKSTLATGVSNALNIPWIEGDSIHSQASISKMAQGIPLTDQDRWLWLEAIQATALLKLRESDVDSIVVTCSALKRSYRDELRKSRVMESVFFMLESEAAVLKNRIGEREGHYRGVRMVESQLEALEEPGIGEGDVVPVDASGGRKEVLEEVLGVLASS